ncbi:MAG: membrane protein [Patescibacteria group bacterium]|nr:MAG: membrane protein [Patescibacteria group bacterium]
MIKWFFVNFITLLVISAILPGFEILNWTNAVLAVFIIGLINITIKPLVHVLSLPITFMTLGLFAFVINAAMLLLADAITPGFNIDGFWTALIASILMSIISSAIETLSDQAQKT